MDGNKKSILLIAGLSLDKRDSVKIHKEVSKDHDLKKFLSRWQLFKETRTGKAIAKILKFIAVSIISEIVIVLLSWVCNVLINSITGKTVGLFDFPLMFNYISSINIISIFASLGVSTIKLIWDWYKFWKEKIPIVVPKIVIKGGRYRRFVKLFKYPLDIWNLFVSNISDAQTLVPFLKEQRKKDAENKPDYKDCSLFFTGVPYYDTVFIDSIYIDFKYEKRKCDDPDMRKRLRHLPKYARRLKKKLTSELRINYINHYKTETFNKPEYERDTNNLFSGYVFGIRFLSKFLYKITEKEDCYYNKYNGQPVKISMTVSDDFKLNPVRTEALKQAVDLSTNDKFYWNEDGDIKANEIRVKVGMTVLGTKSRDYRFIRRKIFEIRRKKSEKKKASLFKTQRKKSEKKKATYVPARGVIRIPFKRPIAVPKREIGKNAEGLARCLPVPAEQQYDNVDIIYVGGAEHNLALLSALREYRNKTGKAEIGERIGILENEYDYNIQNAGEAIERPILISSEKLVQSFYIHGHNENASKFNYNYIGEFFRFRIEENTDLYSFFGYSAPMTKIISSFLAKAYLFYKDKLFLKEKLYQREISERGKSQPVTTERLILMLYNDCIISDQDIIMLRDAKNLPEDKMNKEIKGIYEKYRRIYNFPALGIWDRRDFINIGNELDIVGGEKNNWRKLSYNDEAIILINKPLNMEARDLQKKVNDCPFGHNVIYIENL